MDGSKLVTGGLFGPCPLANSCGPSVKGLEKRAGCPSPPKPDERGMVKK